MRLPFALISSFTAVCVYYVAKTLASGDKLPSLLSALYFIVMMPALVYGRMVFAENLIALLFLLNVFFTIKIDRELTNYHSSSGTEQHSKAKQNNPSRKLCYLFLIAALTASLGIVVKFDGIIISVYFAAFLVKERLLRRGLPFLGITWGLGIALPLALVQLVTHNAVTLVMTKLFPFLLEMGSQLGAFHAYLLNVLPSGVTVTWSVYDVVPEFWYIFLYFAIAILIYDSYKQYLHLFLALGVFVAFFAALSGAFQDYWLIMIQPLLALAFGPGVLKLMKMPLIVALGFYAFPFVPLTASLGEFVLVPGKVGIAPIFDTGLFLWNLSIVLPVLVLLLAIARVKKLPWRSRLNGVLLIAFFAALLAATFLTPDLYPYYVTWRI